MLGDSDSRRHGRGQRGSTLVELMIGAILAGQGGARPRGGQLELDLALNAARKKIEDLRALPIAEVPAQDGKGFAVSGPTGSLRAKPDDADGLPGRVRVEVAESVGAETLYRITASVDWTGVSKERTFSLVSLIGDRRR